MKWEFFNFMAPECKFSKIALTISFWWDPTMLISSYIRWRLENAKG